MKLRVDSPSWAAFKNNSFQSDVLTFHYGPRTVTACWSEAKKHESAHQQRKDPVKVELAVLKSSSSAARPGPPEKKVGGGGCTAEWTGNLFGGHGTSGNPVFYHLWVTVTVRLRVGVWEGQGGGQRVGEGGDVVLVVVVWLGRPLRVTAGEEVGACPGHSSFLFGDWTANLLPGNHRNIRSAATLCACVRVCVCVCAHV